MLSLKHGSFSHTRILRLPRILRLLFYAYVVIKRLPLLSAYKRIANEFGQGFACNNASGFRHKPEALFFATFMGLTATAHWRYRNTQPLPCSSSRFGPQ